MIGMYGLIALSLVAADEPWNDMDYGPFLSAVIEVTPDNIAPKGIAVPLDDDGRHAMLFDTAELRWAAGWTGDFVELKGIVYDGPHGVWPKIAGTPAFVNRAGPGLMIGAPGNDFTDPREVPYGPLPDEHGRWKGLVRDADGLLMHYTAGDARVFERPGGEQAGDLFAWSRSLEFHDVKEPITLSVLELEDGLTLSPADILDLPDGGVPSEGTEYLLRRNDEVVLAVHAKGIDSTYNVRDLGYASARVVQRGDRLVVEVLPPKNDGSEVKVPLPSPLPSGAGQIRLLIAPLDETDLPAFRALCRRTNAGAPAPLAPVWNKGSDPLWPQRLALEGELNVGLDESDETRRITHTPDDEAGELTFNLEPGQRAHLVLKDGSPINGSSAYLSDAVVLVEWDSAEAPRSEGWDVIDGQLQGRSLRERSDLLLQNVELGQSELKFDGSAHATWRNYGQLEFLQTPLSVAAWIRTSKDGTIFSQANAEGPWIPDGKTFFIRGGRLCYDVGWVGVLCGDTEVNDDSWHHVAFTWNPNNERVALWVDGKLDAEGKLAPKGRLEGTVIRFGFTAKNFPGRSWFEGSMNGIRILKRELSAAEVVGLASGSGKGLVQAFSIRGLEGEVSIEDDTVRVVLDSVDADTTGEILEWFGPASELPKFLTSIESYRPAQSSPFMIDRISWPEENPWRSWMRFGDFDFLDGGQSAVLSTWNGDVWRVDGIDRDLDSLDWQRIASGLSQPLGLKTRGDEILVVGRDQVTRLVDLNGDRETDQYEAFNVDTMNAPHFHEPVSGMQVDAEGNLYYMKGARHAKLPSHPQHGTTIKMSPDGLRSEILASGYRAPNGLWVDSDGVVFGTDQEGHWTPANRINRIVPGGFYGNNWSGSQLGKEPRADYDPPLCWVHPTVDRSPSGVVRVPTNTWGDLGGRLLGISYGTGSVYMILEDEVDGIHQGGVVPLPIEMPTGTMRGRFSPADGDLYIAGLFGWSSNKTDPGGFYRVRRGDVAFPMPMGVRAVRDGLVLFFNEPISTPDEDLADAFSVEAWNYEWTKNYGSLQYDIQTGQAGTTRLPIEDAAISIDRRTVWLDIPDMKPVMQMHVEWSLEFENANPRESFVHLTVHKLTDASGSVYLD